VPRSVLFWRHSLKGVNIRPKDNSGRPDASTRRGPATEASGWRLSSRNNPSTAPAGTIVSLFKSRTDAPEVDLIPVLAAAANPLFLVDAITFTSGQRCAAATLPSLDALSTTTMS